LLAFLALAACARHVVIERDEVSAHNDASWAIRQEPAAPDAARP
jgi:hypothetical protein